MIILVCVIFGSALFLFGNNNSGNNEPLSAIEILRNLAHDEGYCVIIVTHNLEIADASDLVFRMSDGEIQLMLGVLAVLFVIERGMDALGFWQILRVNRNFIFRLTVKAQNHLMKLPVSYFKDNQETQIINNLQMDIEKISLITDRFTLMVIVQVFGILGAVVVWR